MWGAVVDTLNNIFKKIPKISRSILLFFFQIGKLRQIELVPPCRIIKTLEMKQPGAGSCQDISICITSMQALDCLPLALLLLCASKKEMELWVCDFPKAIWLVKGCAKSAWFHSTVPFSLPTVRGRPYQRVQPELGAWRESAQKGWRYLGN